MKGANLSLNDFVANIRRWFASLVPDQESGSSQETGALQPPRTGSITETSNGILTHERGTAQVIRPAAPQSKRIVPANAIRGGVAAVALLAGGWLVWSWVSSDGAGVQHTALAEQREVASEPGAILGLRPTFTPTALAVESVQAEAVDANELAQIVIVTPTPDPRRALRVAGAVIDRPLAVADGERAAAPNLMNLLPAHNVTFPVASQPAIDLSNVRIPPMVEEVIDAPVPEVELIPLGGTEAQPVEEPAPALAPAPAPLPETVVEGPTRVWSSFEPKPSEENDHFWVESAFLDTSYNREAAPSYQFGSTAGGSYRPHHGLDIANSWGTPVRAGTTGTVVFAGLDDPIPMGPYPNFYGNTVVVKLDRRLPVAGGELDAFLLYGHLSRVTVEQGQHVEPSEVVGEVGMSGIAIGPHLHVEMRVGENTYQNSVNAYLWLKPAPGNGVVAVRLVTADGRSWPGVRLTLARFENGRAVWGRAIETYLDNENIGPNPSWGENGAMGDVPAGYYVLIGNVNGEAVRAEFFVRDGQTTFVEIRTKQ